MLKFIKLLMSLVLVSLCLPAHGSDALQELGAHLEALQSFQAEFIQTNAQAQGQVVHLSGKIYLQKKAKLRWETQPPESRLLVSDGQTLWDFDRDLEQIVVKKLKYTEHSPLLFLSYDSRALAKNFKVSRWQPTSPSALEWFQLQPKSAEAAFEWVRIAFNKGLLNKIEMLDQLGQTSMFQFRNARANQAIPAHIFQFVPPPGVDVVKG